jgi:hypothetical protein
MKTVTTSAIAKKEAGSAFKGKETLPPDRMPERISPQDYQRILHDEFDIGCASACGDTKPQVCGTMDFDHHLF